MCLWSEIAVLCLCRDDGVGNRSQMVALLKQASLPFLLVDNGVSSSLIHQYSESYRSWFSDIFLIRSGCVWGGLVVDTSPTEYCVCRLFSSEESGVDGGSRSVAPTSSVAMQMNSVAVQAGNATTWFTPANNIPALSTTTSTTNAPTSTTLSTTVPPTNIPSTNTVPTTTPSTNTPPTTTPSTNTPPTTTPSTSSTTPTHPVQLAFSATQTLQFNSPVS